MHWMTPFCHAGFVLSTGGPHSRVRARALTGAGLVRAMLIRAIPVGAMLIGAMPVGGTLVLGTAAPAVAGDSAPAQTATGSAAEPYTRCRIVDPRLPEISGLGVAGDLMVAMNDGGEQLTVYVLDSGCQVVDVRTAPVDPYDPEDLALGADGSVWLADTGDNRLERPTVAMLELRPDGTSAVYRIAYPDRPHDAESLLLAPDGTPYLVTKEVLGASGVYRPVGPLVDGGTVALERVGEVDFTLTGTPGGPVGRAGQLMATGGAVSRDGRLLALRTYTDAYVWPLTGSDVTGALSGAPVRVPLPESPQGEAISFAADDRQLVVSGEGLPADVTVIPAEQIAPVVAVASETAPADEAHLSAPPFITALIAAAIATAVVWAGGRILRRRRRPD